jgi:hypothetical protein
MFFRLAGEFDAQDGAKSRHQTGLIESPKTGPG